VPEGGFPGGEGKGGEFFQNSSDLDCHDYRITLISTPHLFSAVFIPFSRGCVFLFSFAFITSGHQ